VSLLRLWRRKLPYFSQLQQPVNIFSRCFSLIHLQHTFIPFLNHSFLLLLRRRLPKFISYWLPYCYELLHALAQLLSIYIFIDFSENVILKSFSLTNSKIELKRTCQFQVALTVGYKTILTAVYCHLKKFAPNIISLLSEVHHCLIIISFIAFSFIRFLTTALIILFVFIYERQIDK